MASRFNHRALSLLLIFKSCFVGSCATFHSPISRSLESEKAVVKNLPRKVDIVDNRKSKSENPKELEPVNLQFDWPVDKARLTRGFLPKKRRPHLGIDLAAPKGTPIYASQSGVVIYAGREFRGYGKMVLIESTNGWATLYAHFDRILVAEGQKVTQGDIIGAMGRTGRATGVHLHFEIRTEHGPIDPLPMLPRTITAQL